jgi:hypothetical protein
MKQIGSATTIYPVTRDSATGTQLGAHGLETPENLRLCEWLAQRKPGDVDKAAVSQASRRGVTLAVEYNFRFPKDDRGNSLPTVMTVRSCKAAGEDDARELASADLQKLQMPAPVRAVEGWLAELSVITAKRADDEFSETLRLEAYASRLRRYPADVAREAILGRTWKFWPTWAEMELVCETLAAPRKAMLAALTITASETEERARVTPDAAARIMAEVWGAAE